MLEVADVNNIVQGATLASIPPALVSRVETTPTADSEGKDALSVLIVIGDDAGQSVSGEAAVEAIFAIQQALLRAGDHRFPIVHFATEEELASSDDPEY